MLGQTVITDPTGAQLRWPYLLHWSGSRWTSIKIPYELDDLGGAPVAQDGHGGIWLSLANISNPADLEPYLLHYLNGRWTRVPVPTSEGYRVIGQVALSWIPGTRSLWGAAVEYNVKSPKGPGKLLILRYGGLSTRPEPDRTMRTPPIAGVGSAGS